VAAALLIPSDISLGWGVDQPTVARVSAEPLNEAARMNLFAENISVPEASIDNRIYEVFGDGEAAIWPALSARPYEIQIGPPGVVRNERNCRSVTEIDCDLQQSARRFPVIVDMKFEIVSVSPTCNRMACRTSRGERLPLPKSPSGHIGSLDWPRVSQLSVADRLNGPSEISHNRSGDSSYQNAPRINRFSEPPSREEEYVITVAIVGGFALAAYLVLKGKIP